MNELQRSRSKKMGDAANDIEDGEIDVEEDILVQIIHILIQIEDGADDAA